MADHIIMKAVEFDKLPAKFRKEYPDLDALQEGGWWLQKKYDGCFAYVDTTAQRMYSRTGELVRSCPHVIEAALCVYGPGHIVIGEAWAPDLPFPEISGHFRRHRSDGERLVLIVNDVLRADEFANGYSDRPYFDRFRRVSDAAHDESGVLGAARTYAAGDWLDAMEKAVRWQEAGGFDGAILRSPHGRWQRGLVKNGEIVKVKPTLSLDLKVVGYQQKPGAKTGRPVVTLDVEYRGVITTVGSGVPHDLTGVDTVGRIIEVESLGLTADGKLREPRFKGVRFDKHEPDA